MVTLPADLRVATRLLAKSPRFTVMVILTLAVGIASNSIIFSTVQSAQRLVYVSQAYPGFPAGGGQFSYPIFRDMVLSNGFWRRQFAARPDIVGRTIHFNDRPFTVVGVLSEDFRDSLYEQEYGEQSDAMIPLGLAYAMTGFSDPANRAQGILWGIGHLKPGINVANARADMAALGERFSKTFPDDFRGYGLVARPLRDQLLGMFYAPAWILVAASIFLLLIGCANVGNLLLSRVLMRRRDLAVRVALGASGAQIMWPLLFENALLLSLAAALGTVLSYYGMNALAHWGAGHLPTVIRLQPGKSVLLTSVCTSMFSGLLFGAAPVVLGSRADLREALQRAGRGGQSFARRRGQKILVVAEVALAIVLLAVAGLLTGSFRKLTSTDLGFSTKNLLTLRLDLRSARYTDPPARARFVKELVEKLQVLPGVATATVWGPSMLGHATWVYIAYPEGASPEDPDWRLMMGRHSINPGALKNLEIPLLRGREVNWQDSAEQLPVAIISESVAKRLWPTQEPIGKRMRSADGNFPWVTVIGVARDAHHAQLMDLNDAAAGERPGGLRPQYDVYFPYLQRPNPGVTIALRISQDSHAMSKEVREVVLALDASLPAYDLRMLDDRLAEQVAPVRTIAMLSSIYALAALFLAAFGLFAVLAYDVGQRTREIGIRMALGALPHRVLALILREGMALTLAGLGVGFAVAFFATRMMQALLFGVSATEPSVFASMAILLLLVAALACCLPARRAMRLDPLAALRQE